MSDRYLTTQQAADLLHISLRWVQRLVQREQTIPGTGIPAIDFDGVWMIKSTDVSAIYLKRELNRSVNTHTPGGKWKPRK